MFVFTNKHVTDSKDTQAQDNNLSITHSVIWRSNPQEPERISQRIELCENESDEVAVT